MPLIVDASVAVAWAFREAHATASLPLERIRNEGGIVPHLWWFELRNGLLMGERRGRLTERIRHFSSDAFPDSRSLSTPAQMKLQC